MGEKDTLLVKENPDERVEGVAKRSCLGDFRSCTDPICLVIFLAYVGGMIYTLSYAFQNGDTRKLTHGMDFAGQVCGMGNMSEKPMLYWCGAPGGPAWNGIPLTLNLAQPICVKECPDGQPFEDKPFCPNAGTPSSKTSGDLDAAYEVVTTITFKVEPQVAYPTKPMGLRFCFPSIEGNATIESVLTEQLMNGAFAGPSQKIIMAAGDMQNASNLLYSVIALGFVLSFLYLFALKWLARPLVYSTLILMIAIPLVAAVACFLTAYDVTGNQQHSPFFKSLPHDEAMMWSQITGAVFAVISLGFILLTTCAKKTIDMCIACIACACDAIFAMPTMLFEPIVGAFLKLAILGGLLWGLLLLVSTGSVGPDTLQVGGTTIAGLSRTIDLTEEQRYFILYYVFGILWIMATCDGVQKFVISYATVLWYYQKKGPDGSKPPPVLPCLRGLGNGLLFHLGSIAFGSFLIAVTDAIRLVLSALAKQAEASENPLGACVAKVCVCCVTCFKHFLEFINQSAYIDIAIRSNSFLPAAVHTFQFFVNEATAILILNNAIKLAKVTGVLSISSLGGYVAYLCVNDIPRWADPSSDNYVLEPLVIVGVATFICFNVSLLFMLVFDMTSDTLLYTFAEQRKRTPGEVQNFAPKALSDLVEKHS